MAGDRGGGWELPPPTDEVDSERFKWAWSADNGALVWKVSGPGDGRPAHEEQVRKEWRRDLRPGEGDVLGVADYATGDAGERGHLSIYVYYGSTAPAAIVTWFRDAFPDAGPPTADNPRA